MGYWSEKGLNHVNCYYGEGTHVTGSSADEDRETNEFELRVSALQIPPCSLCGRPIRVDQRVMIFRAHGLVALAHEDCREKTQ